jgi:diguanylate cyclase (GGDEF)-like protein/putative nucleotidyltransferase with HDIG domain
MSWWSLPSRVKVYISVVVLVGMPIIYYAFKGVILGPRDYYWLLLTAFALLTVSYSVSHPSPARSGVTVGDAFVITTCMLYGVDSAIASNVLYIAVLALLLRRKHNTPAHRIIFNIATAAINVQLYGPVYFWLKNLRHFDEILIPTIGLALVFFISNSLLIAIAISLSSNVKLLIVWRNHYPQLGIDFLFSACAGAGFVLSHKLHPALPFLFSPFVAALWIYNDTKKAKTEVESARAEEAISHLKDQEALYLRTVETLALAVDAKDQTTYGHIRRVKAYALGLARLTGIKDADELRAIDYAALLHDIGKLAIEDYILNKPGRLSRQEFEKMKVHATAGDEILQQVQFKIPVARYVRCHHERWDGTGYPDGLKGEEIPMGARILSIADAFDAIRSSRPYKSAFGIDDSIELLRAQSGSCFDPRLVELFIGHIGELENAAEEAVKNTSELSFRKYFETIDGAMAQADASRVAQIQPPTASEELIRLFEFCGGTGRSLALADALPTLARRLKQIVPYESCIFFGCHDDSSVKAEYACGDHALSLQGVRMGLGKGISGWVAAHKRAMINTDPRLEFQGIAGEFDTLKDALVVPLIEEGDCLGTISLYSSQPAFYSQAHLALLQNVAEQVAPLLRDLGTGKTQEDSLLDPVTGIHRFPYLSAAGSQFLAQAARNESAVSLVYLDIKNFAHYIVLYGSGTGDMILRRVGDILKSELRQTDIPVRFGQHGFIVLLAGVRHPQALRYVHRLQQVVKSAPVSPAPGTTLPVTCQAGIASYPGDGSDLLALLHEAQKSLYEQARLAGPQSAGSEGNVLEFPPRV